MIRELNEKKVVLGLSGGVDSTTAALSLINQGYEVIAAFFDIKERKSKESEIAKKAADELEIEFVYKNVNELFKDNVISNFISEYIGGRTPNPCIVCNPTVKFKTLIDIANEKGAKYIATGHYADIEYSNELDLKLVKMALNKKKDQSYMLYRLSADIISRLILPLSEFEDKEEVREIARLKNLSNANAKDSQEICFIENDKSYKDYLREQGYIEKEGNYIDNKGKVLGRHSGVINYTIGQRKGLGITFGKPMFVTKIDPINNEVTLGENLDLFKKEIEIVDSFFQQTNGSKVPNELLNKRLMGKIRYAASPAECVLKQVEDKIFIVFDEPQRAASPGQSLVIYYNEYVVGGGFIK